MQPLTATNLFSPLEFTLKRNKRQSQCYPIPCLYHLRLWKVQLWRLNVHFFFYFWRDDQRLSSWYLWIHCSIINQVYIYLDMQLYFFANMYFNITLLSLDLSPIFRDLHAFIYKSFFPIFFFHYQWYEF